MIKILKFSIMLSCVSSCSFISYSQVIPMLKTAIVGVADIQITKEFYENAEYSFIKVKFGRSAVAILTLASIQDNLYKWVSASGEVIYTFNGKIIKSEGLPFDFLIRNYSVFSLKNVNLDSSHLYFLELRAPFAMVEQKVELSSYALTHQVNHSGAYSQPRYLHEESIRTIGFKWDYVNKYWSDINARASKSVQTLHPHYPALEIEFYYK